jgi:hypothetical protein
MTADSGEIAITVPRGAILLPEPLASIALAPRYQRISNGDVDGWLLPGRKPGTHITAEHLRKRLAPSGVTSRPGRHGALLALAGRPVRVTASTRGYSSSLNSSDDSLDLRARGFPRLPALPTSSLDGK